MKRLIALLMLCSGSLLSQTDTGQVMQSGFRGNRVVGIWGTLPSYRVTESGKLFYTDARARASLSVALPLAYNSSTGVFSLTGLSTLGGARTVMMMNSGGTAYEHMVLAAGTGISLVYGAGTVTINWTGGGAGGIDSLANVPGTGVALYKVGSINQIKRLKGRPTHAGVLDKTDSVEVYLLNTAVTPGSYGTATQSPTITVDSLGRITAASNTTISGVAPAGAAGGSLSGTYPNPTIANSGVAAATYGSATQVSQVAIAADGRVTSASNVAITGVPPGGAAGGDLTGTYPNPTLVTSGVSAGTYGSSSTSAQITVDAKGRITTASSSTITGTTPGGSAGGDLTGTYPNPTLTTSGVSAGTYGNNRNVSVITVDAKGRVTTATTTPIDTVSTFATLHDRTRRAKHLIPSGPDSLTIEVTDAGTANPLRGVVASFGDTRDTPPIPLTAYLKNDSVYVVRSDYTLTYTNLIVYATYWFVE